MPKQPFICLHNNNKMTSKYTSKQGVFYYLVLLVQSKELDSSKELDLQEEKNQGYTFKVKKFNSLNCATYVAYSNEIPYLLD